MLTARQTTKLLKRWIEDCSIEDKEDILIFDPLQIYDLWNQQMHPVTYKQIADVLDKKFYKGEMIRYTNEEDRFLYKYKKLCISDCVST